MYSRTCCSRIKGTKYTIRYSSTTPGATTRSCYQVNTTIGLAEWSSGAAGEAQLPPVVSLTRAGVLTTIAEGAGATGGAFRRSKIQGSRESLDSLLP